MLRKFIEPNWKELRKLPAELQNAWFYIWDKADDCGVYHYDSDYIKVDLNLGEAFSLKDLGKLPECEILPGERILIKNFIIVNYKELKPGYNPHKPAFRAIEKNKLTLNSSLNQAWFKLVGQEEDEDEDKKEGVIGETKTEPNDYEAEKLLVPEMSREFYETVGGSPDVKLDYEHLLNIAKFIHRQEKFENTVWASQSLIIREWKAYCLVIKDDKFYRTKSLKTISGSIQEIRNITKNGKHTKNGNNGSKQTGLSSVSSERFAASVEYSNRYRPPSTAGG